MDKKKLSQLRYLNKEIELLKEQIDNLDYNITTDTVKGSDTEYPYISRNIKITGVDIQDYERKAKRLKRKLSRRVEELLDLLEEINEYIESIDDSLIRQIIILRYINGLTWDQVAVHIGGGNTADSVRMASNRFLERY